MLLIVIVLVINGCLKGQKQQSLKDYNHAVSAARRRNRARRCRTPLFAALDGAAGKSALDVEVQIDQLRIQAQNSRPARESLSVPGEMVGAQRNLLMTTLDLRVEGMTKIAALLPAALGGQSKQASAQIAGDMEIFLASDVIYSQRVVPLIQQTLDGDGIHGLTPAPDRFLPNLGWLEPEHGRSRASPARALGLADGGRPRQPRQRARRA